MKLWHVSVLRLIVASKPFRGLLVSVATACMLIAITAFAVDSVSSSPGQAATSYYGQAQAKGEFPKQFAPFQEMPTVPFWAQRLTADGFETFQVLTGVTSLKQADQAIIDFYYEEGWYPSPATAGRVELLSGSWPKTAGECVISPSVLLPVSPAIGSWELKITGTVSTGVFSTVFSDFLRSEHLALLEYSTRSTSRFR